MIQVQAFTIWSLLHTTSSIFLFHKNVSLIFDTMIKHNQRRLFQISFGIHFHQISLTDFKRRPGSIITYSSRIKIEYDKVRHSKTISKYKESRNYLKFQITIMHFSPIIQTYIKSRYGILLTQYQVIYTQNNFSVIYEVNTLYSKSSSYR